MINKFEQYKVVSVLLLIMVLTSCNTPTNSKDAPFDLADTARSLRIDDYLVIPKESFEFNSLVESPDDTLYLVTCCQYVYFPFGELKDKSSLKTSILKNFEIINAKRDTFTNPDISPELQWREEIQLQSGNNKLNIYLDNDPESTMHSYILSGEIVDSNVTFSQNIKSGMGMEEFCKIFFDYFPEELAERYKVIEFESCVTSIKHIYSFNDQKLIDVKFISD